MTLTLEYEYLCAGIHQYFETFLCCRNDSVETVLIASHTRFEHQCCLHFGTVLCAIPFEALVVHESATIQHTIPFCTHSILEFH